MGSSFHRRVQPAEVNPIDTVVLLNGVMGRMRGAHAKENRLSAAVLENDARLGPSEGNVRPSKQQGQRVIVVERWHAGVGGLRWRRSGRA